LSGLKEAEVKFSDHLNIRQRAPKGNGTRVRRNTTKGGSIADDGDEPEVLDGTFEVGLNVLGLTGRVYLPEDVTEDQWDAIAGYVKMVIGFRQQAQKPKASI
jgi:hypothetical protein